MARFKIKTSAENAIANDSIVCIDFGTALCKAAVSSRLNGSESIFPLELGTLAEDPRQDYKYFCQSTLFVSQDCRVFFGHAAQARWEFELNSGASKVAKIESIKDWLCQDPISLFSSAPIGPEYLPPGVALSKREAVILLLSYVARLVSKGLEKHGVSVRATRRLSRPVLESERGAWIDKTMRDCLRIAQIVSDSIGGHWAEDGLLLYDLTGLIQSAGEIEVSDRFIEPRAVLEPVAAGFLAVENSSNGQRSASIIIDVGAGTTDLAAFLSRGSNRIKAVGAAETIGKSQSIPFAGDYIDDLLLTQVRNDLGKHWTNRRYQIEAAGKVRDWKEFLFKHDGVIPTFIDGRICASILLSEFLPNEKISKFSLEIRKALESVLSPRSSGMSPIHHVIFGTSPIEAINIVFAGGGAGLPMLLSIVKRALIVDRRSLPLQVRKLKPSGLFLNSSKYSEKYPQLAVAMGGASLQYPWASQPTIRSLGTPKQTF